MGGEIGGRGEGWNLPYRIIICIYLQQKSRLNFLTISNSSKNRPNQNYLKTHFNKEWEKNHQTFHTIKINHAHLS